MSHHHCCLMISPSLHLVGDNVGDVAGMGADLFGSFAESTCAALVIATQCDDLRNAGWGAICFPMTITSVGNYTTTNYNQLASPSFFIPA